MKWRGLAAGVVIGLAVAVPLSYDFQVPIVRTLYTRPSYSVLVVRSVARTLVDKSPNVREQMERRRLDYVLQRPSAVTNFLALQIAGDTIRTAAYRYLITSAVCAVAGGLAGFLFARFTAPFRRRR